MSRKLETLDFIIKVLQEHEKQLDAIVGRLEKLDQSITGISAYVFLDILYLYTGCAHVTFGGKS